MAPKRRAPEAKPAVAIGPRASGGAMFLTWDGGGIIAMVKGNGGLAGHVKCVGESKAECSV